MFKVNKLAIGVVLVSLMLNLNMQLPAGLPYKSRLLVDLICLTSVWLKDGLQISLLISSKFKRINLTSIPLEIIRKRMISRV